MKGYIFNGLRSYEGYCAHDIKKLDIGSKVNVKDLKKEYEKLLYYLEYTLHELPAGVLYGANGATETECAELMDEAKRFEALSATLGIDNSKFIESCRWHYERYPHYLSRKKHFGDYSIYLQKHNGPNKVKA